MQQIRSFKFFCTITRIERLLTRTFKRPLLVIVYITLGHCYDRANRSRASLTETNAAETVGTVDRPSCTRISREIGVHGINYLRYDLHYTKQRAARVVAWRKLGGDSQAGHSRGTKS